MSSWEEDLPLASAWVVHEQRRATGQNLSAAQWMALQQIACEFSTVEEFWTSFEHLPPPSTVFYDGKSSKRVGVPPDARTIESFSIFRAGVLPEWDDPSNKTGGEWYARRSLRPNELDACWRNLVLALVGRTLEAEAGDDGGDDVITGARVVDKSNGRGQPMYRLELWLSSSDASVTEPIKARMVAALADEGAALPRGLAESFQWRAHSQ